MTSQIQKQKPSKEIELLLAELDFGKVQTKVDAIFKQGRKEGFNDMEIGGWIRSRMNGVYSDRTIRNVLPDTAKHQEKVRSAEKTSANERPPLEAPNAKIMEPTNKSLPSPEVRTIEGIENDGDIVTDHQPPQQEESIATTNQPTEDKRPSIEPQMEQRGSTTKYLPGTPEKFGVEYFKIEKLNTYSLEYCRKAIQWLNEVQEENTNDIMKWDKRIHEQGIEIESLKKQLEEVKPFIELLSIVTPENKARRLERLQSELAALKERGLEV